MRCTPHRSKSEREDTDAGHQHFLLEAHSAACVSAVTVQRTHEHNAHPVLRQKVNTNELGCPCLTAARTPQAQAHPAARVAAVAVQCSHELEHDAHPVFRSRIEHLHLRVVERVAWVCHCVASLPEADADECIATCKFMNASARLLVLDSVMPDAQASLAVQHTWQAEALFRGPSGRTSSLGL